MGKTRKKRSDAKFECDMKNVGVWTPIKSAGMIRSVSESLLNKTPKSGEPDEQLYFKVMEVIRNHKSK